MASNTQGNGGAGRTRARPALPWESTQSSHVTRRDKSFETMAQKANNYDKKNAAINSSDWRNHHTSSTFDNDDFESLSGMNHDKPRIADSFSRDHSKKPEISVDVFQEFADGISDRQRAAEAAARQDQYDKLFSHENPYSPTAFDREQIDIAEPTAKEIVMKLESDAVNIVDFREHDIPGAPCTPQKKKSKTFLIEVTTAKKMYLSGCDDSLRGELHAILGPTETNGLNKTTEDVSFDLSRDDFFADLKEKAESMPRSTSVSPEQLRERAGKRLNDYKYITEPKDMMQRDEAIESINSVYHVWTSPHRRKPNTEGKSKHFEGLIGRLATQKKDIDSRRDKEARDANIKLGDPAIIAFSPKRPKQGEDSCDILGRLYAAKDKFLEKSRRDRRDSGYTSPTGGTRGSQETDNASHRPNTEKTVVQHKKGGSGDSGFHSPSKSSTLNPAAMEFSCKGSDQQSETFPGGSPLKRGSFIRHPVNDLFIPPQKAPVMNSVSPFDLGAPIFPPPGFNHPNLSMFNDFGAGIAGMQMPNMPPSMMHLPPQMQMQQQIMNNMGPLMPPPGFGTPPGFGPPPGFQAQPGFQAPHGFQAPPGIAPPPGFGPNGPFLQFRQPPMQQLAPPMPPMQQANIAPFMPPHPAPAIQAFHARMPPLGTMPQGQRPVPPPAAPAPTVLHGPTPLVPGTLPSEVPPKPKVPDTTSQQAWEAWHEMKKMTDPSYAQKAKQNQAKRVLKQMKNVSDESNGRYDEGRKTSGSSESNSTEGATQARKP